MQTVSVGRFEWQLEVPDQRFTYKEALDYAYSKGDEWRLPTKEELLEIVKKKFDPSIDPSIFPNTPPGIFWTTTPYGGLPHYMVTVSFFRGFTQSHEISSLNRVRLVRKQKTQ